MTSLMRRLDRLEPPDRGRMIVVNVCEDTTPEEVTELLRAEGIEEQPSDLVVRIRMFGEGHVPRLHSVIPINS